MIKFPGLMLSKSVEGFVVCGGKTHGSATVKANAPFIGKDVAFPVVEAHASIGLVNIHGKGLCGKMHYAHGLRHLKVRAAFLGKHGKALTVTEPSVLGYAHPHNLRAHHLKTQKPGARIHGNNVPGRTGYR